jgi:hypothetical protein
MGESDKTEICAERRARLRKEVDDALASFGWFMSDVLMTAHQRRQAEDWLIDVTSAIAAERDEADVAAAMAAIDRLAKPPVSPLTSAIVDTAARLNCNAPSPDGQPCWKLSGHVGAHQAASGEPYVGGAG